MPADPRKRQKKMERRSAKRKDKKHAVVRQENAGLAERLAAASKFPVLDCWIGDDIDTQGIGWVVLSREFPNRQVAVASFLVDRYCLGVKNVFAELLGSSSYDAKYVRKMTADMPSHNAAPADARKLLEEAVAYARRLGLAPHPDYPKAMHLFGDVDPTDSQAAFEFGKDGKPFFVSGPNDTPERCRQIVAILTKTCGAGRFHYLVSISGSPRGEDMRIVGPDDELIDEVDDFGDDVE
jgi:hypothetical protein